ncbi:MAG TPA: thioesterase family protein [Candidatus Elarobacter sp.]
MSESTAIAVGPVVRDRVRWSDVDKMDVVYFGRYLRFMEIAEDEFFRSIGFPHNIVSDTLGVWMARVRLEVDFKAPARLDDEIVCRAELQKVGASSLRLTFPIDRTDGTRLAVGVLVLAALEQKTLKATRIPRALRDALQPGG